MLGLFPVAGQDVYIISAPFFRSVSVTHPITGKTATVRVVDGWDPDYNSIYIQNVTVNGEPWARSWIDHRVFTEGWTVEVSLGTSESPTWGRAVEDRPPSYAASAPDSALLMGL